MDTHFINYLKSFSSITSDHPNQKIQWIWFGLMIIIWICAMTFSVMNVEWLVFICMILLVCLAILNNTNPTRDTIILYLLWAITPYTVVFLLNRCDCNALPCMQSPPVDTSVTMSCPTTCSSQQQIIAYWDSSIDSSQYKTIDDVTHAFQNNNILTTYMMKEATHVIYSTITIASSAPTDPKIPPYNDQEKYTKLYGINHQVLSDGNVSVEHITQFVRTVQADGKKAMISIGGWEDLSNTPISQKDINNFVQCCKHLQTRTDCDGFDFNWEHLSTFRYGPNAPTPDASQSNFRTKRIDALRTIMTTLKKTCIISYTCAQNAFQSSGTILPSDEEAATLFSSNSISSIEDIPMHFINMKCGLQTCIPTVTPIPTNSYYSTNNCITQKYNKYYNTYTYIGWLNILNSYIYFSTVNEVHTWIREHINIGFTPTDPASHDQTIIQDVLRYIRTQNPKTKWCNAGGIAVWTINSSTGMTCIDYMKYLNTCESITNRTTSPSQ